MRSALSLWRSNSDVKVLHGSPRPGLDAISVSDGYRNYAAISPPSARTKSILAYTYAMTVTITVQLLQTALVLLQLVAANPSLPQSFRDTAQQVAQNAVAEATKAIAGQSAAPVPVPSGNTHDAAGWKQYQHAAYAFQYPATFALYPTTMVVPKTYGISAPDISVSAVKLIRASIVPILGTSQCGYGQSGLTSVCDTRREAGIEFAVVDQPVASLLGRLDGTLTSVVRVTGKDVTRYSIGSHGDGVDSYYLPLNAARTLIVSRQYFADGRDSTFASPTTFEQILDTLRLQ